MKWLTAVLLVIAAILGALLLQRSAGAAPLGGTSLGSPVRLPTTPLLDDQGRPTTLAASDGRMRLVFFGFVRCPDVCPATLASLKNTYAGLSEEQKRRLQVQFVTVDPDTDTPQLVRAYLNKFDSAFTGLTGSSENIDAAAKAMFVGVIRPPPPTEDHSAHGAGHEAPASQPADTGVSARQAAVVHGDQVSVVNPAGEFVRVYNNQEVIDGTLGRDLPGLLREYGPS